MLLLPEKHLAPLHLAFAMLLTFSAVHSAENPADERKTWLINSIQRNISEAYFDFAQKRLNTKLRTPFDVAMIALEEEHSLGWLMTIERSGPNIDAFIILPEGQNIRVVSVDLQRLVAEGAFDEIGQLAKGQSGFKPEANDEGIKQPHVLRILHSKDGKTHSLTEVGSELNLPTNIIRLLEEAKKVAVPE